MRGILMRRSPVTLACVAAVACLITVACLSGAIPARVLGNAGHTRGAPWRSRQLYWVLTSATLDRLNLLAPVLAARMFSSPRTFVLVRSRAGLLPLPLAAMPTALFTSYDAFQRKLARHAIPASVRAVAYDPELWPATPRGEQRDPLHEMARFAASARQAGYQTVLMPGRDLLLSHHAWCAKRRGETLDMAFTRCGLATGAQFAQVFELQCAAEERDLRALQRFARAGARQALAANPSAVLIATLSTVSAHRRVDAQALLAAARAVGPFVRGFQLNMTTRSAGVAVEFLRMLSALNG
jgi:hypothetical protein